LNSVDNRNYDYSGLTDEEREDYKYVVELIEEGSMIVDLGCGNGSLMQKLIKEKKVTASGMELSTSGVEICRSKGLDVIQGSIDQTLPYKDNEFDYAVCNVTIQMVMFPEILLREMKRVSRYQVISFPNLGFYKNRIELFFKGRMPKTVLFDYNWYNTGHIHLFSITDFRKFIDEEGGLVIKKHLFVKSESSLKNYFIKLFPNLLQLIPLFLIEKKDA
jgi:methionine biosynthesis protein MetW